MICWRTCSTRARWLTDGGFCFLGFVSQHLVYVFIYVLYCAYTNHSFIYYSHEDVSLYSVVLVYIECCVGMYIYQ